MRTLLLVATLALWLLFAGLNRWLAVLTVERTEMFGPVSYFHPVVFWAALLATVALAVVVLVRRR